MPPENWCGYCSARPAGSGMSTSRSSSTARSPARAAGTCPCATWPSMTWRPIVNTGLSVVVGSWKTMPTSRPRMRRSASASSVVISTPSSSIEPSRRASGGSRPLRASAVTLLPEPDSPTMPSTSPAPTSRSTPRTAGTGRPVPTKLTFSPRTRSVNAGPWSGRPACCRSRARCRPRSSPRRSGRCRRCWSGSRRRSPPGSCSGGRRPP